MDYPTVLDPVLQPVAAENSPPDGCHAKTLGPEERIALGVQALAGNRPVTQLAEEAGVSRKFVARQAATAQAALDEAFTPVTPDDKVLATLSVTKSWLKQVVFCLTLICHSSYRGVQECCGELFGVRLSLGTIHNIIHEGIDKAREQNNAQDLSQVKIAGLDEIFQGRRPVLVGADVRSTYCFLLSAEDQRDGDTWALRLLECQDQNFHPQATIADFGSGIRAGQQRAMPGVPCRGDVFHTLYEATPVVRFLEHRAYDAIAALDKFQRQRAKLQSQGRRDQRGRLSVLSRKVSQAAREQNRAMALADDIAVLVHWLRCDVFAVSALPDAERCEMFDFLLAELQARVPLCPHRLGPLCRRLKNHREELLAFGRQLDQDLIGLATEFEVSVALVRELFDVQALDDRSAWRWSKEAELRDRLRGRFHPLQQAVRDVSQQVVRASSIIENINSRLRSYFFLRREIGSGYLELLRFFLNHRRFLRSECPERVGQSPAELLTGHPHAHWLERLGHRQPGQN